MILAILIKNTIDIERVKSESHFSFPILLPSLEDTSVKFVCIFLGFSMQCSMVVKSMDSELESV